MDFLKELNINDSTIDKIKSNNLNNVIRQFICDRDNASKIIKYLQESKVSVVDDLLIRRLEIFSIDFDRFKKAFEDYNKEVLVALINEDISAINFL